MLSGGIKFQEKLKYAELYLSGIDDCGAAYLLDVLKEEFIQNVLEELCDESKAEKEDIYVKIIQRGYRLCDIQALTNIINEDGYELIGLPVTRSNTDYPVEKEEVEENNIYDREPYYFEISYKSCECVGMDADDSVIIESNFVSLNEIKKIITNRFASCSYQDKEIVLNVEDEDNVIDYESFERCNIAISDYIYSHNIETKTVITSNRGLDNVYYYLRQYLCFIAEKVCVENSLIDVRRCLFSFDQEVKQVELSRVIGDSVLLNKLNIAGCFKLEDLLKKQDNAITKEEARYLLNVVKQLDTTKPFEYLKQILNTLAPREIAVIKQRYLGDAMLSLEEVGKKYGCTRERIRQIESKASKKLLHPSRKKRQAAMIDALKMYCSNKSFVTEEEIQHYFNYKAFGIFADKILNLMSWSISYRVCFFNNVEISLDKELEELPTEFTISELEDYAEYIAGEIRELSKEEIKFLILRRFNICGDFIVKGKIKLRAVLSFLMKTYFPDGVDIYDEKNILFLREKAREHFDGLELAENDRAVRARLQDFCVPIGRGMWRWDSDECFISDELKNDIINYIEQYNAPILPIQAIMDEYAEALNAIDIDNKYYLQGQIKKFLPQNYSINRDYIFKGDTESFYKVVEAFVKDAKGIVTKKDIIKQFPGVTDIVIQQASLYTKVLNMNGYYVHLDNLNITEEEKVTFKTSVEECIQDNNIYHAKNIFNIVKRNNSGLFSRVGVSHYLQFYYLLKELFPLDYEYNRPFIAHLGVEILSGEAQVIDRIIEKKEVTIAELREIVKDVGTVIDRYIEFVDRNSDAIMFKNHSEIVSIESAAIEDASFNGIDAILADFIKDENYLSLSTFFDYWKLPVLTWNWNEWALYSIINKYSQKFKTAVTSNYLHEAIPIIVKNEFDETKIDFSCIEKQDIEEEQEDILDMLDYDDLE